MHSLPYTTSFSPINYQAINKTPVGFPAFQMEESTQSLYSLVSSVTTGHESDGSNSPSWPESPGETLEATQPSSTTRHLSLTELINQTTNAVSVNSKAISSVSLPKNSRETRIKRPMNAFMVWSQQRRQQISATGQKFHNSDISKMLGAEWRKMDEQDKIPFVDRAKQLREEHFRDHPDYVYRPRRRKRVAKSSGSVDSVSTDETSGSPTSLSNNFYSNVLAQFLVQCVMRNGQLSNSTSPPTISPSQPDQMLL